ncbi:MAG: ribonuclease H-like domain-containing protein [Terriglobia bacterium]
MFRDYPHHKITVLGLRICDAETDRLVQWVGEEISKPRLLQALAGVEMLVTYNGRSVRDAKGRVGFDFPVIAAQLDVVLDKMFPHTDLVLHCWQKGLYGGLKKVEDTLGLKRAP